ncbi:MAG TPA: glycerol-3-phosphate 1-O-acyltransferase PlsY [Thermoanaerobaculia bacterium]|nr:glycerol-3-phosphate 1-O-acyltransferase PlsY [Thermoanaerobaculia bacterium]
MESLFPALLVLVAYLIGSIPFSFLIVKLVAGDDIRRHGSGNVGATNVARNFGKLPGVVALLLDAAKGWLAIHVARSLLHSPFWPPAGPTLAPVAFWIGLAGFCAIVGHMFPIWLRFRGGKGVATACGVFLAINPLALAGAAIIFLIVVLTTRFISLGSIIGAASIPLLMRFMTGAPFWTLVFTIAISIAIISKHHDNISRLIHGKERKFPS